MQSQGPYHNIQQLSDAVQRLEAAGDADSQNAASFLVTQIQPLVTRITTLEALATQLQAAINDLRGVTAPKA